MLKYRVGGRYRLEAHNPKTGETRSTGWFANLILNQGMNFMGQGVTDYLRYCQVGSGSTTPSETQIQLAFGVASVAVSEETRGINPDERYAFVVMKYHFPAGAAAGNLAEVGIGRLDDPDSTGLFSRALIKDPYGNPTVMTVLQDEELRVFYEFRVYQPTADTALTVNGTAITIRASGIDSNDTELGWWLGFANTLGRSRMAFHAVNEFRLRLGDGALHDATVEGLSPSQQVYANASVLTDQAYVADSFQRLTTLHLGPDQGNFSNGNPISMLWLAYGPAPFQMQFDPPLAKDDTLALTIGLTFSWARQAL